MMHNTNKINYLLILIYMLQLQVLTKNIIIYNTLYSENGSSISHIPLNIINAVLTSLSSQSRINSYIV